MKRLFPQSFIVPSRFACPNKGHSSNEQNIDSETCLGSFFILRGFCKRKPVNPAGIAIPILFLILECFVQNGIRTISKFWNLN